MQRIDGQLLLSPSGLTAYLACPHLTTLELAVARGEREKTRAELVFRKGREREAAYLERLRAEGKTIVETRRGR